MWRLLTRQIDTNAAQDDAVLREACTQARYGTDTGPAEKAVAATRSDYDRRAACVHVLAESTAGGLGSRIDRTTGRVDTEAAWTDRWAARSPTDPDAQLVRAESLVARAWEVRGGGWACTVSQERPQIRVAAVLCTTRRKLDRHDVRNSCPAEPWGGGGAHGQRVHLLRRRVHRRRRVD